MNIARSLLVVVALPALAGAPAQATTNCTFTTAGSTMTLDGDCWTDTTISIPDGFTLFGANYTITAIDPVSSHFVGAVVRNGGQTASVDHLTVTVANLANVCDGGDDRLRGIMFDGASGSISHNTVVGVHQGPSGCQEGNAIEVRNAPFDGTHPLTRSVAVTHNRVIDYQKTGIVCNGDVNVTVQNNQVGASATQANLAANSLQLGFGALGIASQNQIDGNQWLGCSESSPYASTAILVYDASTVTVSNNNVRGNSDIGIYILADGGTYDNNKVHDSGSDLGCYDIGIGNYGTGNTITNNKVKGFDTPYENVVGGNNHKTGKMAIRPTAQASE